MSVHNVRAEVVHPGDVYVGRATSRHGMHDGYFGNPFNLTKERTREQVVQSFERHARERISRDPEYGERVRDLFGKRLFCWCMPLACHGEVLERLAKELAEQEGGEAVAES